MLNVSEAVSLVWLPVFTQAPVPPVVSHRVLPHCVPPLLVALTDAEIVAPGSTMTLEPPLSVAELITSAASANDDIPNNASRTTQ